MNLKSIIETILFVHGEPITLERLANIAGAREEDARESLNELIHEYTNRGFCIMQYDGTYQLGSNPTNAQYVNELVKSEFSEELSRTAMETLAIIAYKGPLTRVQIEYIRGVNSSFILRTLLMRGLVERTEDSKDARSYCYQASGGFLQHLGITRRENLPHFEEFNKQQIEILELKQQ